MMTCKRHSLYSESNEYYYPKSHPIHGTYTGNAHNLFTIYISVTFAYFATAFFDCVVQAAAISQELNALAPRHRIGLYCLGVTHFEAGQVAYSTSNFAAGTGVS
jgi:hypothetical protein